MKTYTLAIVTVAVAVAALSASAAMAQQMAPSMVSMQMGKKEQASSQATHKATATVKKLDEKKGVVTLAHGPVPSLNWPPMSMGFKVKDKALLSKLGEGKKVEVEFIQDGGDYVLTSVK